MFSLIAAAALVSAQPGAALWTELWRDQDGPVYYDARSVERRPNMVRVWLRFVFEGEAQFIALHELDCARRTIRRLNGRAFELDGRVIGNEDSADPPRRIFPDTNDAVIADTLCGEVF